MDSVRAWVVCYVKAVDILKSFKDAQFGLECAEAQDEDARPRAWATIFCLLCILYKDDM